jgi:hypothetical protein
MKLKRLHPVRDIPVAEKLSMSPFLLDFRTNVIFNIVDVLGGILELKK